MEIQKSSTKKIISALILAVVLILSMVLIPYILGFARTGFSDTLIFQQYMLYAFFGGIMLIGILILYFIEVLIKEKDNLYGDGIGFSNQGEFPSFKIFGKYSTFQIALFSFIIISVLGFANFLTINQSFFGIGTTAQQFTPVDSLTFRTFLIAASENLGLGFLLALFLFSLRYYCRKKKVTKPNFYVFALIGVILLSAMYGFGLHQLAYSGQETDLNRTMIIWTFGGLVTFFTGNFVVFWMFHLVNNLFIDLRKVFPSEIIMTGYVVVIIVLMVLFWFLYIKNKKSKSFI